MPRQKVSNEQVQRQEMVIEPGKEEITDTTEGQNTKVEDEEDEGSVSGSVGTSSDHTSIEMDEDVAELDHHQAYLLGVQSVKGGEVDRGIRCFQAALKKFFAAGHAQASPAAAEYWLAYGNALLKAEEHSSVFSGAPDDNGDGDLKLAWESLDLARVCFDKRLEELCAAGMITKHPLPEKWAALTRMTEEMGEGSAEVYGVILELWEPQAYPEETMEVLRNTVFTRLRLGDFCQVHMRHEEAITEFAETFRICYEFKLPYGEALQALVPLAHSLVGLGDKRAVPVFKLACRLIDAELPSANGERLEVLKEFKPDLMRQLEDFEQEEAKLVKESEAMAEEEAEFGKVEGEPVDLGRVGGARKSAGAD